MKQLLLAKSWDPKIDPTGWWMSEKLDGIRAYWDGCNMWSRTGKLLYVPQELLNLLPKDELDGELYAGRGQFQKCVSIVRTQDYSKDWSCVEYRVFDLINTDKFEERQARLLQTHTNNKFWRVQKQIECLGGEHLLQDLKRIESLGGEGCMLRKPGSYYEHKRSGTLLKVKTFKDAEAEVLEHLPGLGKHKGRLGAVLCKTANGITFKVGSGFTDAERENPPEVGTKLTYAYQELTNDGVPRFPTFVRRYEEC